MRFASAFFFLFFASFFQLACAGGTDFDLPPPIPPNESLVVAQVVFANGSIAKNSAVMIFAQSNKSESVYRSITDQEGKLLLSLERGKYQIDALLDYYNTPGTDFASTSTFSGNSSPFTIILYPAGSLSGKVIYSGSPVPSAKVRVLCPSNSFDYSRINGNSEVQSGEAGEFLFRALPTAICVVSASTGSFAASKEVQIAHGQHSSVELELKSKVDESGWPVMPLLAAAFFAALFFLLWLRMRQARVPFFEARQPRPQPSSKTNAYEKEEECEFSLSNPKAKAIISTLSQREAQIVKFLMKCNGRAKRSQIQHKLLIPKTSLLRNLRALERKNIVRLTPFGRNLLAELEENLFK
ncbi:MAG: hypothetical protein N3G22_03450 [Candidatus Micrarchaeota archaeon]|nr:hypothetical protein [Candidatus Micrarchaeota archaeon]